MDNSLKKKTFSLCYFLLKCEVFYCSSYYYSSSEKWTYTTAIYLWSRCTRRGFLCCPIWQRNDSLEATRVKWTDSPQFLFCIRHKGCLSEDGTNTHKLTEKMPLIWNNTQINKSPIDEEYCFLHLQCTVKHPSLEELCTFTFEIW